MKYIDISKRRIAYLDTETTGFYERLDGIISLAVIVVQDGKRIHSYYGRYNPRKHIPSVTTKVHGFDDSMVVNYPFIENEMDKIIYTFSKADICCAYNSKFDKKFLEYNISKYGDVPHSIGRPWLDPLLIFQKEQYGAYFERDGVVLDNRKLGNVYSWFLGKKMTNAHNAFADTEALVDLHLYCLEHDILPKDLFTHLEYQKGIIK